MDDIKDIIGTIVRGCAQGGVIVSDVLAAFVARTVNNFLFFLVSFLTFLSFLFFLIFYFKYFSFINKLYFRLLNQMQQHFHLINHYHKNQKMKLLFKVLKNYLKKIVHNLKQ